MSSIPVDILRGLLYDECPGERDHYLCCMSEVYDDDICTRCWLRYIEARERANTRRYLMLDKEVADVEKARRKARKHARELIKSIQKTKQAR